jgi:hypothetical protein
MTTSNNCSVGTSPLYDIKINGLKTSNTDDVEGYVAIDKNNVLRKIEIPKTVNQTGFEIRLEILTQAINFMKFQNDLKPGSSIPTTDDVITICNKFYGFVEGKRGK